MSEPGLRADKWLWYARFFKTRSLATKVCNAGQLRIAGSPVTKAHSQVRIGDVLTFPQARHVRVIKVLALAERRGPAAEARLLYEDLKPPDSANRLPKDRLLVDGHYLRVEGVRDIDLIGRFITIEAREAEMHEVA